MENAWHERRSTGSVLQVVYDRPSEMIVRGTQRRAHPGDASPVAEHGYQAGVCFYCSAPITRLLGLKNSANVDHYFPHMLMARGLFVDLDDVWNLVLAERPCV